MDRSLTDDEMGARFLHNVALLDDDDFNPGTPLPETASDTPEDVDPVMAALDDLDTPLTAEQEFRIRHAPPSPCQPPPERSPLAERKQARLDTIKRMTSRYQPGGAVWQDDNPAPSSHAKWLEDREQWRARRAGLERKRYADRKDREEAEAKAAGRPFRRHQSLAGMTPEERKARKAEQDLQAQHRRRAKKR
ncbi:hypothetical protein MPLB_2110009 [Mesorhizobium sp. ORS 3324]|nr:hypothetical protein MPLB_2110009 [Mesorhizobium sp. ORS 3324]